MVRVPSRRRCLLAAALLTACVTGCASRYEPVLSDHAVMPAYSPEEVGRLNGGTVLVEVAGDPFALPAAAFRGQVAANMDQSAAAPAHFAAAPAGGAVAGYRVVWNFSPPHESVAPNAICRGRGVARDVLGMPIDVYAAFCRGGEALSSVRGRLYYTDTPNSLEFLNLIGEMTAQLFPKTATGLRRSGDARLGIATGAPRR